MGSLTSWAHSNRNTHQCILLLVDDLESVAGLDLETLQNFRWLLLRGPAETSMADYHAECAALRADYRLAAEFPHTYLGRVANGHVAEALSGDKASGLDQLEATDSIFPARERELASLLAAELLASPFLLCYNRNCMVAWMNGGPTIRGNFRFLAPGCL